jgi:hypothetical protein
VKGREHPAELLRTETAISLVLDEQEVVVPVDEVGIDRGPEDEEDRGGDEGRGEQERT